MTGILELERSVADLTQSPEDVDKEAGRRLIAELELAVSRLTRPERELRVRRLLSQAHELLGEAKLFARNDGAQSKPRSVAGIVTLFSGGNDSTTLAHIFRKHVTHIGVANTGIGIEQTRQYVRDTASLWGLPILEKYPEPGYGFEDLILGNCRAKTGPNKGTQLYPGGFPGPAMHYMMYQRLKERAFEQIRSDLVNNPYRERVIFLAGRRATESSRRNKLAFKHPIERKGSTVWCAPLINWTKMDLNTYRLMNPDVPRNEASDLIHMSGECLCGSFAHENELDEVGMWFPAVKAEIQELERKVVAANPAGVRKNPACATWGWAANRGASTGPSACECRAA